MLNKLIKNPKKKLNLGLFNTQFQRNIQNFSSYLILIKKSNENDELFRALQNKHKDNYSFLEYLNFIKIDNKRFNGNRISFDNIVLTEYGEKFYNYLSDFLSNYNGENLINNLISDFLLDTGNSLRGRSTHECPRGKNGIFFKRFGNAHPKEILYKFFEVISKSNEIFYLDYIKRNLYLLEVLKDINLNYILKYNLGEEKEYKDTVISFLGQIFYFDIEDLEKFLNKEIKNNSIKEIFNILYKEYIEHIEGIKTIRNFPNKRRLQPEIYQRGLMDIEASLYYHFMNYKKNNEFPEQLSLLKLLGDEFYINDSRNSNIIYLLDYESYNKFIQISREDIREDGKLKDEIIENQKTKRERLKQEIIEISKEEIEKQKVNKKLKRNNDIMNKLRQFYGYKSQITGEIRINSSIYSLINHDLEVHHIKDKKDIINLGLNFNYDNTASNLVVITNAEHKLFTQNKAEILKERNGEQIILKRKIFDENEEDIIDIFEIQPDKDFYSDDLIPDYRDI